MNFTLTKKINTEELEGEIKFKPLLYSERIALSKEATVSTVPTDGALESKLNEGVDRVEKYISLAIKQIESVSVKIKETGEVITDPEHLIVYTEGHEQVLDIGVSLISGVTLGKKKL